MMDWTDRHCRYFLRGFSASALLYTEMIHRGGDPARRPGPLSGLFSRGARRSPCSWVAASPEELAAAARAGDEAGYDEMNLNCGCPSERVASGAFGACLMREPARVAACVAAMRAAVRVPVTVKMRIGVVTAAGAAARAAAAAYNEEDFAALCQLCREYLCRRL